jgi:hypothetical protein
MKLRDFASRELIGEILFNADNRRTFFNASAA